MWVGEQTVQLVLAEGGEGVVGWGEDCEWSFASQRVFESCGLDCCYQGVERSCTNGGINNVLWLVLALGLLEAGALRRGRG